MIIKGKFKKGTTVLSAIQKDEQSNYFACKINGKVKSLQYSFKEDTETEIELLDIKNEDAVRIYEASLRFLTAMALKHIDPKLDVRFFYNISRSVFCRVYSGKKIFRVTPSFVEKVKQTMKDIVAENIEFERQTVSKEEALAKYRKEGYSDKIQVLKYRKETFVHLYDATFKNRKYFDYLYSYLVPSSGFLSAFEVQFYNPGFIVRYPRHECDGKIPEFVDEAKFALTLATSSKWAEINELDTVSNINKFIKNYGSTALVNTAENRVNNLMAQLGDEIISNDDPVRVICVAGPSSSGKTSFANRLMYQLMSRGLRPIRISLDNFYTPRDRMKPDTDIESIEALDVDYFNDVMIKLISGDVVTLPVYDFKNGTRTDGHKLQLGEDQPIIIEGIHALNPQMTSGIPELQKYKIYIAPQPQLNIDYHTPLSMTDIRLLRRIARDSRTRGTSAKNTIKMWPNVRHGEFEYIYPTQENADFVFDSFVPYELSALRNIVLPELEKVKPTDEEFLTAVRLKQMVRYFLPVQIDDIPCNSLMREFVGGSSFKDAR